MEVNERFLSVPKRGEKNGWKDDQKGFWQKKGEEERRDVKEIDPPNKEREKKREEAREHDCSEMWDA